ncbi:hypothetical protein K1719_032878 [Acacia pycnantha]|nr:hypothetical protein K1719_032878 [Acacia pycnantha]
MYERSDTKFVSFTKNDPKIQEPSARYDVFLSFRGEDTRASFTSHLSSSLTNDGIVFFKDDTDLPRGYNISLELQRGIENSTISIVIFSKDYAGSRWCLNELSKIMEVHRVQGRVVLPVFYGVDPSEVRNQTSSFGQAFQDLIERSSPTHDQVLRWRTDLHEAGGIAGFVMLNSRSASADMIECFVVNESEDIKNIVEKVCEILDKKDLFIADHPVGVNSRVQDLIKMSRNHPQNRVLLLGIWGMGGIGKTRIAKATYNEIGRNFESRSFLLNIREVWEQDCGPGLSATTTFSQICKTTKMKIHCVESGKRILKKGLHKKRALVVLDDVDKVEQLNALSGGGKWFHPGSRIIITTRDEHLLRFLKVDGNHVYRMKNMDKSESIELFSWLAFSQPSPREGFVELSRNVVAYSGGLPLALEILGCYLLDRGVIEWESVLDRLKKIPNDQIQKKLKISFDGLNDDTEREIFLDISCFFIGMDRNEVTQILNASGLFADIGISVLVERILVTIDEKNKLRMHDLLRDMGREIIRERSPKAFGKRSRLWFHEDVIDVLSKHTGTESVEGLALNLSQDNKVSFFTKAFKKMNTLRLLRLVNVELDGDYKYISRDLKWLCWHKFPLKYVPANLFQNNLVAIELKYNSLRLWREPQVIGSEFFLLLFVSLSGNSVDHFLFFPNETIKEIDAVLIIVNWLGFCKATFQYIELPYGNFLLSQFSTSKIPPLGSISFQITYPPSKSQTPDNVTTLNPATSHGGHALKIENDTDPNLGIALKPGEESNMFLGSNESNRSSIVDNTQKLDDGSMNLEDKNFGVPFPNKGSSRKVPEVLPISEMNTLLLQSHASYPSMDVVDDRIKHCLRHVAGDADESSVCAGTGKCRLFGGKQIHASEDDGSVDHTVIQDYEGDWSSLTQNLKPTDCNTLDQIFLTSATL